MKTMNRKLIRERLKDSTYPNCILTPKLNLRYQYPKLSSIHWHSLSLGASRSSPAAYSTSNHKATKSTNKSDEIAQSQNFNAMNQKLFHCDETSKIIIPMLSNGTQDATKTEENNFYYSNLLQSLPLQVKVVDSDVGRGLFTTKATRTGELIFAEVPLVSALNDRTKTKDHCANCMTSLAAPAIEVQGQRLTLQQAEALRASSSSSELNPQKEAIVHCPGCGEKYCSMECMDKTAVKWHSAACESLKNSKLNFSDYRDTESMRIWELTIKLLFGLVNHSTSYHQELASHLERFTYVETPSLEQNHLFDNEFKNIQALFQNKKMDSKWVTDEGIRRIISIITTNSFSFTVYPLKIKVAPNNNGLMSFSTHIDKEGKAEKGTGLYTISRYANHVCSGSVKNNIANAFPITSHTKMVLTTKNIPANSELCWSYLGDIEDVKLRRAKLHSSYGFWCHCDVCTNELESVTN